ncbi:GDP-mannose 4,6-dehydratase [soil metagenome]
MTRALITGVTGQDGSYLAEMLLDRGDEVHGVVRSAEEAVTAGVIAHQLDLAGDGVAKLVKHLRPDVIFNLAAVSSVFQSWEQPAITARLNGLLVADILAVVRELRDGGHESRFIQASSAEIFGAPEESPQDEQTAIRPTSPYGAAKAYAHGLVGAYRGAAIFASSLILYNHESPRRPDTFVTRKITSAAARISLGLQDQLELGNLEARRDWGWAPDYVAALVRAAEADRPGDFIIATGVAHSVADFVGLAFARAGVEDWKQHVNISEALLRTGDAPEQVGDATLARRVLGWAPTRNFDEIVNAMVDADLALLRG